MNNFLYKILPMILSLAITQIIYIKLDKKYNLTNRLSIILHIKQKWMAFIGICYAFIIILSIGIIGIYIIDITPIIYFILCGVLTGIVAGMKSNN